MFYDAELAFFQKLLSNFHLNPVVIQAENADFSGIDQGLRKLFGLGQEYERLQHFVKEDMEDNTVYKIRDAFFCTYIFLRLPDTDPVSVLMIGPYTTIEITRQQLMQLTEKYAIPSQLFSTFEKYLSNIPFVANDSLLTVALNTLGEKLWGDIQRFSIKILERGFSTTSVPLLIQPVPHQTSDQTISMQALEDRYASENRLLQAVSQGLSHKAEQMISNFSMHHMEKRALDPIRNLQNYCIIMNTLLRKAAEQGFVHPLYIDRLSSDFARKIEGLTSQEAVYKLQKEMVHKYCLLVKNYSTKGYSMLVQKVITFIDSDLTANLSLNALSGMLSVNASYLSNLFKKETGSTLTEYVNKKRVEHGILLLNSTSLQIQTIAQYCGVPDVNYFTKIFKKHVGKTPSEYREEIMRN